MGSTTRSLFLCVVAAALSIGNAFMVSMVGGTITWRLHPQFESNRIIYFKLRTAFDKTDGLDGGSGITIELFKTPAGPSLVHGDKFGTLVVVALLSSGDKVELYPNEFIVTELDGDLVHGEMEVEFEMPEGSLSAVARLRTQSGGSLIMGNGNVGGLPNCNPLGTSPTPCTLNEQAGVKITTPALLDLATTVTIPATGTYSAAIRNQIKNRHSPQTWAPLIQHVTQDASSFAFQYWDLDGDMVRPYTYGSTDFIAGAQDVVCDRTQAGMTQSGCSVNEVVNAQDSAITRYEGNRLMFVVLEPNAKAAYKNLKFYYTLLMEVHDGPHKIMTIFDINFCFPEYRSGENWEPDRAPEFVAVSDMGAVTRGTYKDVTIECHYLELCTYDVYAAHFAAASGLALSDRPTQIVAALPVGQIERQGPVGNSSQVYSEFVKVGPSTPSGPGGVTKCNITFGRASNSFASHEQSDIGLLTAMCFKAVTEGIQCWSVPICVKVKIIGSPPQFVAPTPPLDLGEPLGIGTATPVAVCFGSKVRFTIKATDPDTGDLVILNTYDNGTDVDGVDLFGNPYNASKVGSFRGATEAAELGVEYLLSDESGVLQDYVTRFKAFPAPRIICSQARDSTLAQYYRWGGTALADYYSQTKCHEVRFLGPPMFVTDAARLDATPFAALVGSVDERARLVHGYVGFDRSVTFWAQDPNKEDRVEIIFLADPGLPNGATLGPNECSEHIPPSIPQLALPGGACSAATRTVTWRPQAIDVNRTVRMCATARDNSTLCVPPRSPDPRATSYGWYGEEHCVDVFIVAPSLAWVGDLLPSPPPPGTGTGAWRFPDQQGFVGCKLSLAIAAVDVSVGLNASGISAPTPYTVALRATDPDGLPAGLSVSAVEVAGGSSAKEATVKIEYVVPRGVEGSVYTVCFEASEAHGAGALPVACMVFSVQRCMYCAQAAETLESVMRELVGDSNWLRLWAANGNDDGNPLTPTITHPDQLLDGAIPNPANPTQGSPFHVGNIYEAEAGDSVVKLASMFHTTVKEILRFNPDISHGGTSLQVGQEVCLLPCTRIPSPSNDYAFAY